MPEKSRSDGFAWAIVNADEKRLVGILAGQRFALSSADLAWITQFAAQRRLEMDGEPALHPDDCPNEPRFRADAYVLQTLPHVQTAVVWSRLPGIGWVRLLLDANEMRGLAQNVLSTSRPHNMPALAQ